MSPISRQLFSNECENLCLKTFDMSVTILYLVNYEMKLLIQNHLSNVTGTSFKIEFI